MSGRGENKKKEKKGSGSGSSSRIRSLSDLNHDSDTDSDGPQEYYTGGQKSGMLVQDPNKQPRNDVDEIFNQARQLGSVQGPSSSSFTGNARSLTAEPAPAPHNVVHNIVFWTNGFTVNDGPLRSLDDPQNAPFLQSIKKSECPRELEPTDRKSSVHVNLIRRDENYREPVVTTVAFQGVGRTLGRNTDEATSSANTSNADATTLAVDATLPSTSIQLRLADGTRMIAHFNHHHTVADIRAFINASRPDGSRVYHLQTVGFPPKLLSDPNQTIEQAGLANSVVIQKL
ncbi:hypothetical protein QVD17_17854 [Tagetes erecta]|uniref:Uncharacterized protein n=1 Tax=Tagetes erecta TaxID=13708 RepID=A0AAD8KJK9_TARER|nr:hypothetical protein QVD17_17854 [Tagetes erecta]